MGYDFYAYHRLKDDKWLFSTNCMYAYEPVFKKYIGNDKGIQYFNGRVSKKKIGEFKEFIQKLESDNNNNLNHKQMSGYMGNISFDKLIKDFKYVLKLMEEGRCKYFSVG